MTLFELGLFITLMLLGYGFGRHAEKKHYRFIMERERELQHLAVVSSKVLPDIKDVDNQLVSGNVVISVDYFKRFLSMLRNIFGGRVTTYETLLDRARREAILRMKGEAKALNAKMVLNVKMETCSIYKGRKNNIGSVEILAYGTALVPKK
ncbi:MAG: heavy metal-binding domain-containing protein [Mariprofundaceae bacterium]